jgi:hypothetical protein
VSSSPGPGESATLGDIPLFLTGTARSVEYAPTRISVGHIRLGSWVIQPLGSPSEDFAGHAGYLVRANYDLGFEADVPPPRWVEVGFEFSAGSAVVTDALPRSVRERSDDSAYDLSRRLCFVRAGTARDPAATGIDVPPLTPRIDCSGIGGGRISWRHTETPDDQVRHGAHPVWFCLAVPQRRRTVQVMATCRYALTSALPPDLRAVEEPDAFTIRLPVWSAARSVTASASAAVPSVTRDVGGRSPRVFVTYAHDTDEHKRSVAEFCAFLDGLGMDVRFDRQQPDIRRNWNTWTTAEMMRADFVIVIASPVYREVDRGTLAPDYHPGVQSEFNRLADLLHRDGKNWLAKILPVVLPDRSVDEIPLTFLPNIADHYVVERFTTDGARSLLRVLLAGS